MFPKLHDVVILEVGAPRRRNVAIKFGAQKLEWSAKLFLVLTGSRSPVAVGHITIGRRRVPIRK